MGSAARRISKDLGLFLRRKRDELGLTLREVSERTGQRGERLPESTLTRIEQGKLDPGACRLFLLMRLYNIQPQLVGELVELEMASGNVKRSRNLKATHRAAIQHWRGGDSAKALACLRSVHEFEPRNAAERRFRQRSLLTYATYARNLGQFHLSKRLVDDLLCEQLEPTIVWKVLVLAASLWRALGSPVAAMAMIRQAYEQTRPDDHEAYAQVLHQEAKLLLDAGRPKAAAESIENALRHYRDLEDTYGEVRALILQVKVERELGHGKRAVGIAKKATKLAREHDHKLLVAYSHLESGRLLATQGNHDQAVHELNQALGLATMLGEHDGQFYAQHALWKVHESRGERQQAEVARSAAQYHVRYVGEDSPEADEVRAALSA